MFLYVEQVEEKQKKVC